MMQKSILLVDDDALVLKSIRVLLEKKKYKVVCAKNSDEAKERASSEAVDLIISDIRMPGQDGVSFIRELKEKLAGAGKTDIPFIFITGYASEDAPIDAVKLGARDYLLKPFDLDELLTSVQKQIGS